MTSMAGPFLLAAGAELPHNVEDGKTTSPFLVLLLRLPSSLLALLRLLLYLLRLLFTAMPYPERKITLWTANDYFD